VIARLVVIGALVGGVTACGPKGSAPGDAAAGSSAVADSVTIPDSSAPRRDTVAGRDSAFPPKFVIDSAGKVTPVPKSKKP
jgi:hypothetical protein